jgi:hypothetical protein
VLRARPGLRPGLKEEIDVLSAKRQFQLFCSEHFPDLADILDCLAADQLWALLSMRVQLTVSDQPHAQIAKVGFGGLGRRYVLVAFNDRPVGLLSHADGSGLLPEARPKLTALSWEEIRLALMAYPPHGLTPEHFRSFGEAWRNCRLNLPRSNEKQCIIHVSECLGR